MSTHLGLNLHLTPTNIIALPFLLGGSWCLIHPSSVLRYATNPKFLPRQPPHLQTPDQSQAHRAAKFTLRCFGCQALLVSVCLLTMKPTKLFYKVFGGALVPFFVFDFLAVRTGALNVVGGVLDGLGNVVMLAACWIGWRSIR
ncbi:hypothetical protein HK097_003797 [Rhizophlyctis rosea]|uniref:Uncharacterized protein n=1 Tax=Rhizophlyctis rosea TaxID=64517 RepID=A0AAD5WZV4_9FUNG|nr:hypothetical protein HK097_003797 [Rhizophlyctis rosea]